MRDLSISGSGQLTEFKLPLIKEIINKENKDLASIKLNEPLTFYNSNKEIIPKKVQNEKLFLILWMMVGISLAGILMNIQMYQ